MSVVLLAVVLRLVVAWIMGNDVKALPGIADQVTYDRLALRVSQGDGFTFERSWWPLTAAGVPTAHWSYLFTLFLAGIYGAVGHNPLGARIVLALVTGVALPVGLHRIGRRLGGERVGWLAALWGAAYPYFVYYSAAIMTEMVTIVTIVWLLVILLRITDRPTFLRWAAVGGLAGVAGLLRQVALLPLPLVVLWMWWRHRRAVDVRGAMLAAVIAMLIIAPATVRNWRAFDRFVPVNTNAGFAFFWANHPVHGTDFMPILPPSEPSYQALIPDELRGLDEAALSDALMARGLGFVRDDPVRFVRLSLSRIDDYFMFWPAERSSTTSNLARVLSFGLALPFMAAGLWMARRRRAVTPLVLYAGTYALIHLLSWALIRYRLPVDALLLPFAAVALDGLVRLRGGRPTLGQAGRESRRGAVTEPPETHRATEYRESLQPAPQPQRATAQLPARIPVPALLERILNPVLGPVLQMPGELGAFEHASLMRDDPGRRG